MAERLLWHIFRVLNVFTHVLDGVQPSTSTSRGTGLPHLSVSVGASALPSPIKRRTSSVSGADLRGVSPAKTGLLSLLPINFYRRLVELTIL